MQQTIEGLYRLMRFDRPAGTILLFFPTFWALILASHGWPTWHHTIVFTFGVVIMRAAGCVVNDMADSEFDQHVARTKNRPLAAGVISRKQALFTLIGLLIFALMLVATLNLYSQIVACIALGFAILYPFTKRFFSFPQLFLGVAWSCGILMAFSSVQNQLPLLAWLIFTANLLLTIAYDSMYAMADKQDDLKIGIHSAAILFGEHEAIYIFLFQLATMACFIFVGIAAQLQWPYWASLMIAAGLMIYQQRLIQQKQPANCLRAFLNNQWLGAVVLLGILFSV